ncbi:MAG: hypothetical protein JNL02_04315 [Saprospiraceae bacterium]|nr:hypothetical protein [Saprospiraceae bacterium]
MRSALLVIFCLGKLFGFAQNADYPSLFTPQGIGGGGYMYSPSISPHDPDHIFLNCDMGGVYRSLDGGRSWQMQHYQQLVSQVKGKVQFTADPAICYVCRRSLTNSGDPLFRGELAKSTDGGASWQPLPDPTASGVHRLEVDPGSTQRLLLNEYNQLFFSADGGNSWVSVFHPADDKVWLGGAFWDGDDIFVGTDKGLLVSHDGGQTFAPETHAGLPAGAGILHLSGSRSGNLRRLYCVAAPEADMYAWYEPLDFSDNLLGIYRMDYAAGAAWTDARGNLPDNVDIAWIDLALSAPDTVWAAGSADGALPVIYRSTDGGNTWVNTFLADGNQNISTGWGGDGGAYSYLWSGANLGLDVDNNDPDHLIVTDGYGHVTTDGGASWQATYVTAASQNPPGELTPVDKFYQSSGLDVTSTHQIFWLNEQEIIAANTDIGQSYSADGGETWTFARNTFFPWGVVANNNWYRVAEAPNGALYAATAEINDIYLGYRIADGQIYGGGLVLQSTDAGVHWDTLYNFGHPVVWLEVDPTQPGRLYASVVDPAEGGIYQSNDGGQSWLPLPAPPRTEGHPYNLGVLNDGGLLATYSARALPDGVTLTPSSGVFYLPAGSSEWQDRTGAGMEFYTKDLIVNPHDPAQNTWYATVWGRFTTFAGPNNAGNGGLYRSTDRGLSWTRIFTHERAESLTIHPELADVAYLSVENEGLFFTEQLAADQPEFERVTSMPYWRPKRVFFQPGNACRVWVATMGGGIWQGETGDDCAASGTSNVTGDDLLRLFPNPLPAGDPLLYLDFQHLPSGEYRVGLYDSVGRAVLDTTLDTAGDASYTLPVGMLPPGAYVLHLRREGFRPLVKSLIVTP